MLKRTLATVLFLSFCGSLHAQDFYGDTHLKNQNFDTINAYGSTELYKVQVGSINVNGTLAFDDLTVKNKLQANGPTEGKNSTIDDLTVSGPLQLEQCKITTFSVKGPFRARQISVEKASTFTGPFAVEDSQFNDITLTTNEARFANSKVNNITINKDNSQEQKVYLSGNTVVNGNIEFQSGKGQVIKDNSATINGKIIGGTLFPL